MSNSDGGAAMLDVEAQNALGRFMAAVTSKNQENYNNMLQEKLAIIAKLEVDLKNVTSESNKSKSRIGELEAALDLSRRAHADDKARLQNQCEEAEQRLQSMHRQQQQTALKVQADNDQKTAMIRQLEAECSKLRVDASQNESKVESLSSEMNELHSAMASLHGEISVLQRETEEALEKERKTTNQKKELSLMLEMKDSDLVKAKLEKEKLESRINSLETKLNEAGDRIRGLVENQTNVENLVMERNSMQSIITQMENRLKQQTSTNQELNGLLNKLHGDIQRLQQDLNDSKDECSQLSEHAKIQEEKLRNEIQALQSYKTDLEAANTVARKECDAILSDMTVWKEKGEALLSEQKKQMKRIEKLEREKHELFIELGQKTKDAEQSNIDLQTAHTATRESKQLFDELKAEMELMKRKLASKEDDVDKLNATIREIRDTAAAKENKLREETARCEQVIESSRAQQRENANRVVDFSQKNAKLTADLTLAQDELDKLKAKISSNDSTVQAIQQERDESVRQHNATRLRLQSLEDTVEELTAKLEAAEAEAEDCRRLHQEGSEARAREATLQRQNFEQELRRAKEIFQTELDEKTLAAANSRRQAEQHAERTVARARETFQRQIEELQAIRKREQADFNSRTAAITSAMEGLQRELREESIKSTAASEELFALRDQLDRNNREDESGEVIQRLEREKARDRVKYEGIIQSLKDDLQTIGEKLDRSEQQCSAFEQRLVVEKEAKSNTQQKLRRMEEELHAQQAAFENANQDGSHLKKQLRDTERKAAAALSAKDAEIQRLIRRGEVLSEAVNRLTAGGAAKVSHPSLAVENDILPEYHSSAQDVWGPEDSKGNISGWNDQSTQDHRIGQYDGYEHSPPKTQVPVPHQPKYPGPINAAREAPSHIGEGNRGEMPPPSKSDVAAHLQRVQNALDRRRSSGNGARTANADAGFGRSLLQQAVGSSRNASDNISGRSTAPSLSATEDDDLSKASNDEGSHRSGKKKRVLSAPGLMSPSPGDRRAHQPVNTILGPITPNTKTKQTSGLNHEGKLPAQFLADNTSYPDDTDIGGSESNKDETRPTSGENPRYVQKIRDEVDLYHTAASPSPSPAKAPRGGGITYLTDEQNVTDNNMNSTSKSKNRENATSKSKASKVKKSNSTSSNNSNKLAEKAYG